MAENDSRLRAAEAKSDMQVVATLTEWTLSRKRRGTRYVSERRQVGTKQVTDSKGNTQDRAGLRIRPQQTDRD